VGRRSTYGDVMERRKKDSISDEELDSINVARRSAGLPLLRKKDRACLRCSLVFESFTARLCPKCGAAAQNEQKDNTILGYEVTF
jgi:hypothetical protein